MKLDDNQANLVRNIEPERVRKYLLATNWIKDNFPSEKMELYHHENNKKQIALPLKKDFADYPRRISELIETLTQMEKRSNIEILNEFLLPISDIIKFRIDNKSTKRGSVPLNDGIKLLKNVKQVLYAAALSVKKPNTFFSMLKDKDVDDFIHSCMLGQTERGSYVATVICPVDTQLNLMGERVNNFGREATINLMTSLDNITKAMDQDPINKAIDKSLMEEKFNFNFCEALMELQPEDKDSNISVTITWAAEEKPKVGTPTKVTIRKDHYERLPKIMERLNPIKETMKEKFIGKVDENRELYVHVLRKESK